MYYLDKGTPCNSNVNVTIPNAPNNPVQVYPWMTVRSGPATTTDDFSTFGSVRMIGPIYDKNGIEILGGGGGGGAPANATYFTCSDSLPLTNERIVQDRTTNFAMNSDVTVANNNSLPPNPATENTMIIGFANNTSGIAQPSTITNSNQLQIIGNANLQGASYTAQTVPVANVTLIGVQNERNIDFTDTTQLQNSVVIGHDNNNTNVARVGSLTNSTCLGNGNQFTGDRNTLLGNENTYTNPTVEQSELTIVGQQNTITSLVNNNCDGLTVVGVSNNLSFGPAYVLGTNMNSTGADNILLGHNITVTGGNNIILGPASNITGDNNVIFDDSNSTKPSQNNTFACGNDRQVQVGNAFAANQLSGTLNIGKVAFGALPAQQCTISLQNQLIAGGPTPVAPVSPNPAYTSNIVNQLGAVRLFYGRIDNTATGSDHLYFKKSDDPGVDQNVIVQLAEGENPVTTPSLGTLTNTNANLDSSLVAGMGMEYDALLLPPAWAMKPPKPAEFTCLYYEQAYVGPTVNSLTYDSGAQTLTFSENDAVGQDILSWFLTQQNTTNRQFIVKLKGTQNGTRWFYVTNYASPFPAEVQFTVRRQTVQGPIALGERVSVVIDNLDVTQPLSWYMGYTTLPFPPPAGTGTFRVNGTTFFMSNVDLYGKETTPAFVNMITNFGYQNFYVSFCASNGTNANFRIINASIGVGSNIIATIDGTPTLTGLPTQGNISFTPLPDITPSLRNNQSPLGFYTTFNYIASPPFDPAITNLANGELTNTNDLLTGELFFWLSKVDLENGTTDLYDFLKLAMDTSLGRNSTVALSFMANTGGNFVVIPCYAFLDNVGGTTNYRLTGKPTADARNYLTDIIENTGTPANPIKISFAVQYGPNAFLNDNIVYGSGHKAGAVVPISSVAKGSYDKNDSTYNCYAKMTNEDEFLAIYDPGFLFVKSGGNQQGYFSVDTSTPTEYILQFGQDLSATPPYSRTGDGGIWDEQLFNRYELIQIQDLANSQNSKDTNQWYRILEAVYVANQLNVTIDTFNTAPSFNSGSNYKFKLGSFKAKYYSSFSDILSSAPANGFNPTPSAHTLNNLDVTTIVGVNNSCTKLIEAFYDAGNADAWTLQSINYVPKCNPVLLRQYATKVNIKLSIANVVHNGTEQLEVRLLNGVTTVASKYLLFQATPGFTNVLDAELDYMCPNMYSPLSFGILTIQFNASGGVNNEYFVIGMTVNCDEL